MSSKIVINGKTYVGDNISVHRDGTVKINGKAVDPTTDKIINISIEGNVDTLDVEHANEITIKGDCGKVDSGSGNVSAENIYGDVKTGSGKVKVSKTVTGNVQTGSGDVTAETINGSVRTGSGDIKR
jgi:hypothetical protein